MDCVNSVKCLSENGNLIQNLYTGQEATIQIHKPTIYAEYALREAGVEDEHGLKDGRRNIYNLCCPDYTILIAENANYLLMKGKEHSGEKMALR